jgi:hypothetical protein
MIADIKADSERWEDERRATASRGRHSSGISFRDPGGIVRRPNTPIVEYRASTSDKFRKYYGPTEAAPAEPFGYQQPASSSTGQLYYSGTQGGYYPQQRFAQPPAGYQHPQGYAMPDGSNYYVAQADMTVDPWSSAAVRVPATQSGTVLRSNVQHQSSSSEAEGWSRGHGRILGVRSSRHK